MKRQIIKISFLLALFFIGKNAVYASDINLTIRDKDTIIFSGAVPLPPAEIIELNTHPLDANSVLSILNDADILSPDFSISDLQYYDSFSSFYLKCITSSAGNDCDNWQYTVNDSYPGAGMDKNILTGGENVYVYFGPQNKILLSSNNIKTTDTLTVTTQKYDYHNNAWIIKNGITVGLTQPDPDPNSWTPLEIQTSAVGENGEAIFQSIPAGSYNVGIQPEYFPTENLTVTVPPPAPSGGSGNVGGGGSYLSNPPTTPIIPEITPQIVPPEKIKFDLKKAFDFLIAQQEKNGSFGQDIYTDWTTLAFASSNYQDQTIKLVRYAVENKTEDASLTDNERHAMALLALGLNPYNTNNENYIEKILAGFDGKQFGNVNEDNDDIFALIVLQNVGYTQSDKIINDDISFILGRQKENGSFDESVDMTGATIEALSTFSPIPGIGENLEKAKNFLKEKQKEDGGWGNASSTAWALEGITALGEKAENWKNGENTPLDYLSTIQDTDGGIKNENINTKIWETAYVSSILSGKTWNQIMQKFEKPKVIEIIKIQKKFTKKQKIIATEATAINAIVNIPTENKIETPRKNWFIRLLENIFGF